MCGRSCACVCVLMLLCPHMQNAGINSKLIIQERERERERERETDSPGRWTLKRFFAMLSERVAIVQSKSSSCGLLLLRFCERERERER